MTGQPEVIPSHKSASRKSPVISSNPVSGQRRHLSGYTYQEFEARGTPQLASGSSFRISNETNLGVPSLLVDQWLKECPAFLSSKPGARSVWCRRGAPAWSSIWTASRRGSPASSSIPRKKVSGCVEISTLGAAKWSNLSSMKRRPAPSAAAWSGSAKPALSRREKSAWQASRRSSGSGITTFSRRDAVYSCSAFSVWDLAQIGNQHLEW
jgi:hypothetical protein